MNARSLIRNTFSNSTSLALRTVISYVLTPFLINYLGKEQYGIWMILVTFTLTGSLSFFTLGFQGALIKYVAEYHTLGKLRQLNEVFSATLLFYAAMGLLCSLIVAFFGRYYLASSFNIPTTELPAAQIVMYIFAVMVVVELPGLAVSAIIEGLQRYDLLAVLDIARMIVFAGATLAVVYTGHGLVAIAFIMLVSTVAYVGAMIVCARMLVPGCRIVIGGDRATLRNLFTFTRDLLILRINGLVYNNMDKIIIGAVAGAALVTDYDIANRIHSLVLTVAGLAPAVVLPAASALHANNDEERKRQLLLKGSKYATAMTLPVVIVMFIIADRFIELWISPQYAHVASYARLFLLYLLFWPVIQVGWNMLVGINQVKSIVPLQTVSVVINLLLTVLLVKQIGVAGAIVSTIVANALVFVAYLRLILNTFQVSLRTFLREVVLPAYLLGGVLAFLFYVFVAAMPPQSLLQIGIYAGVSLLLYYAAFFAFGMQRAEQLGFLKLVKSGR